MSNKSSSNNIFVALMVAGFLGVVGYMMFVNFFQSDVKPVEYAACETEVAPDGVTPVYLDLELKTGNVLLELRPDLAPNHVDRLKSLAEQGFYDGIVFHRVIEGFMAQTGDPTGTGMGGSELPDLAAEFTNTPYTCGTIGMARSQDPNSANSQFFITFDDARFLDGQYTVLGFVRDGMEHIHQIKKGQGSNGAVSNPDKMISLKVTNPTS